MSTENNATEEVPTNEGTEITMEDRQPTEEENAKFDEAVENISKMIKPRLKSLSKSELVGIIAEYQVRLGLAQQLIEAYKGKNS